MRQPLILNSIVYIIAFRHALNCIVKQKREFENVFGDRRKELREQNHVALTLFYSFFVDGELHY